MSRPATAPELALFRTPGQFSKLRAAIFLPSTVYTARVNQAFATTDGVLEITYDTGVGTLADVKADMTLLVGSATGLRDKGIVRVRSMDATKIYIGETSDIAWADNLYLTVINDFRLWARHILISGGVPTMDGGIAYSDQHKKFDPTPIMGGNRILKLEGASVSATYDASASYVYNSTISSFAWSAPTASASSGMTTATPTITWNTTGWHVVYLTLTSAAGKQFFGVRYVYVWNSSASPASATIGDCRCDAESGGWNFSVTLYDNVDLDTVRDHALIILFAEDYYGNTKSSIGSVAGCENILAQGWIATETINWEPENGQVEFTAYTAHFWLSKIPAFPDGVELVVGDPTAWTEMKELTVDRGVWHFLHWRTTATRIMDVFLSGDTRYTKEVSSLASTLWEQIREMAFLQIFARAGCNAQNQFYLQVHPQLTPQADRATIPVVMTIEKGDRESIINFERVTITPTGIVSLDGVAVIATGEGVPYFSLSPGHTYPHYGSLEMLPSLLLSSQAQANELAGLYRAWQNNPYPDIPIIFSSNNRLIDCFPRQFFSIVIDAADTPRGIAYNGKLIPTSVSFAQDIDTGYVHTEATFEAEVFSDLSTDGDAPGGGVALPAPSMIYFPPLPEFKPLFPLDVSATPDGPTTVLLIDSEKGILISENFNESSPTYRFWNTGLLFSEISAAATFFTTPNGAYYLLVKDKIYSAPGYKIYRAPGLGGVFVEVINQDWFDISSGYTGNIMLIGLGYNPNRPEEIAFVLRTDATFTASIWIGSPSNDWVKGAEFNIGNHFSHARFVGHLTFGGNKWVWDRIADPGIDRFFVRFSANAATLEETSIQLLDIDGHYRAGSSAVIMSPRNVPGSDLIRSIDNADNLTYIDTNGPVGNFGKNLSLANDGLYMMGNWDAGGGERGKSSDGGTTWSGLPTLPFGGMYCFAYAGGAGVASRWIAARGVVRYSPDFGNTWQNKEGNIASLIPIDMMIVKVLVPGYSNG